MTLSRGLRLNWAAESLDFSLAPRAAFDHPGAPGSLIAFCASCWTIGSAFMLLLLTLAPLHGNAQSWTTPNVGLGF